MQQFCIELQQKALILALCSPQEVRRTRPHWAALNCILSMTAVRLQHHGDLRFSTVTGTEIKLSFL